MPYYVIDFLKDHLDIGANEIAFVEVLGPDYNPATSPNLEVEVSIKGQTGVKPWRVAFEKTSNPWWPSAPNGGLAEVMIGNDTNNVFQIAIVDALTNTVVSEVAEVDTARRPTERLHISARVVFVHPDEEPVEPPPTHTLEEARALVATAFAALDDALIILEELTL